MTAPLGRKAISHARIVDTASRAIRRSGYAGIGVAEIMRDAGLTHGGFYAHFRSRDAMLVEAVERASRDSEDKLGEGIARRLAQDVSPLRALVEAYLSETHLTAAETGCPLAALAAETPRQPAAIGQAARKRLDSLKAQIRAYLPADTDDDAATVIAGTLIGTLQIARMLGDNDEGRAALAAGRRSLIAQFEPGGRA